MTWAKPRKTCAPRMILRGDDQELVDYFHRHFDFQEDADLIDRLTKPARTGGPDQQF